MTYVSLRLPVRSCQAKLSGCARARRRCRRRSAPRCRRTAPRADCSATSTRKVGGTEHYVDGLAPLDQFITRPSKMLETPAERPLSPRGTCHDPPVIRLHAQAQGYGRNSLRHMQRSGRRGGDDGSHRHLATAVIGPYPSAPSLRFRRFAGQPAARFRPAHQRTIESRCWIAKPRSRPRSASVICSQRSLIGPRGSIGTGLPPGRSPNRARPRLSRRRSPTARAGPPAPSRAPSSTSSRARVPAGSRGTSPSRRRSQRCSRCC